MGIHDPDQINPLPIGKKEKGKNSSSSGGFGKHNKLAVIRRELIFISLMLSTHSHSSRFLGQRKIYR